ncbi:MUC5A protein, partial [Sula dactylatra]|nr:MUC5A protein [Sula dactylatra]
CFFPPDCECVWTDWIDVSYPNSSDSNSGDYETFENIQKNSSWVCAKAEQISCRAEKFPQTPIADLQQKVECNVNTGLICNNRDQLRGPVIQMPVCLNYQIRVCCVPSKPECLPTATTTPSVTPTTTTQTISTTAPTPTPSETPSSTTMTTMAPSSTTSSTASHTTTVPSTPT